MKLQWKCCSLHFTASDHSILVYWIVVSLYDNLKRNWILKLELGKYFFVSFIEKVTCTKASSSNEELKFILIEANQNRNCFITKWETDTFSSSQCFASVFNLDKKFHGLSCFWGIDIHETVQKKNICHQASERVIPQKTNFWY